MKAIVWTAYGPPDVLQLRDVPTPVPGDKDVLIKVHAATVTKGDCELRNLTLAPVFRLPFRLYVGAIKPTRITILGQELAGIVEQVGSGVSKFKPGERVYGTTGFHFSANAEYCRLPAELADTLLARIPSNLSFEQAAGVATGGLEALHFLKSAKIEKGQRVLIYGAGGSIGTFAIQLAKHYGAHVTAVDRAEKFEMMRSLGADEVLDYRGDDFTKIQEPYAVIFDIVGKTDFFRGLDVLEKGGHYLLANPTFSQMVESPLISQTSGKKIVAQFSTRDPNDLEVLSGMLEKGELKSVVDRCYPLAQTADAHRYVESGMKQGNVIINVV